MPIVKSEVSELKCFEGNTIDDIISSVKAELEALQAKLGDQKISKIYFLSQLLAY
jgi:hypothetical protein